MRWQNVVLALSAAAVAAASAGCTPHIGDKCNVNSDCSIQGNLQCDTSQPGGYCTLFNCTPNACPDNAACVALNSSVPGCPYDDYQSPSRTSLNMCLESCSKDSDCRTSNGYVCRDPRLPPWNAVVVDNNLQKVCLPLPTWDVDAAEGDGGTPAVCQAAGPPLDGSVFPAPPFDAGEAGIVEADADADAGVDAMGDRGAEDGAADAGAAGGG